MELDIHVIPFVGSSYQLKTRKADVQRTINLMPTRAESGKVVQQQYLNGAKAQMFLQAVPGLGTGGTLPDGRSNPDAWSPPTAARTLVDCDLLLHFDETNPLGWRDYSINERAITINPVSGSIAQNPAGEFAGAAAFTQAFPGNGAPVAFDTQAFVGAAGLIDQGSSEFFWSAWVKVPALAVNNEAYTIFSNTMIDGVGNLPGMQMSIRRNDASGIFLQAFGAFVNSGGTQTITSAIDIVPNTWTLVSCSRAVVPSNPDRFSVFINGVSAGNEAVGGAQLYIAGQPTIIGALTTFGSSGPPFVHAYGFQGEIDELILGHGPGWGVINNFTPPTAPYNRRNPLPPV